MTPPLALIGALVFVLQGAQSPTIRIDSREQGRTFFVDPDHPEIRKALRDVSAPSPAGPMPEWVPPPPDAKPWGQRGDNAPVDCSSDRMHRVTVNIRRGARDTHVRLMGHYTLPRP